TALPSGEEGDDHLAYVPVRIDKVRFYDRPGGKVYAHARLVKRGPGHATADCTVLDEASNVVATIEGMRLQTVDLGARSERGGVADWLYEFKGVPQALAGAAPAVRDAGGLPGPRQLAEILRPQAETLGAELGMGHFYEMVEPRIHAFGVSGIVAAFRKLG